MPPRKPGGQSRPAGPDRRTSYLPPGSGPLGRWAGTRPASRRRPPA